MPCRPPMMFVNIVGQASFHTAGRSGPSMMERSYRLAPGEPTNGAGGAGAMGAATGTVTSVIRRCSEKTELAQGGRVSSTSTIWLAVRASRHDEPAGLSAIEG